MTNLLVRRLESFTELTEDGRRDLDSALKNIHAVEARRDLIREGDKLHSVHVILQGFACRYAMLPDGSRQIMAHMVAGDFCDLHAFILRNMDHNVATLSPCTIAEIPYGTMMELSEKYPRLTRALWWSTLVDEAILRQRVMSLGRRDASERVAHLLCELLLRLQVVGLASEKAYELPLTQRDLADTLGLSDVHLNRVLQDLRRSGLIETKNRSVLISDPVRLKKYAGFNPNYLHLGENQELGDLPSLRRSAENENDGRNNEDDMLN